MKKVNSYRGKLFVDMTKDELITALEKMHEYYERKQKFLEEIKTLPFEAIYTDGNCADCGHEQGLHKAYEGECCNPSEFCRCPKFVAPATLTERL